MAAGFHETAKYLLANLMSRIFGLKNDLLFIWLPNIELSFCVQV